ncbi:N-terminal domain of NEFA-interacting nuclear protein NIP30-domain-containing protein [Polychytrium aggregatum]|uniref:N-terminal domain of NEFA-interacting nuclear protein NIP30-domain-containing protein n=1 Tax=Polychytrium aggregatum TaxID=110093 RepID=UPI0022FEFD58|nr:N-terminal domain of NEFA-interacting nuclear protein NIP30-domain-containing protein [Polychytrium aggregatum]KAI9209871.1 N-terminal domain of NEFA-interacting nuclear protein NIP30-domain-containing protein [Polychytrium aggregatum]
MSFSTSSTDNLVQQQIKSKFVSKAILDEQQTEKPIGASGGFNYDEDQEDSAPYDSRPLYERLQERKQREEEAFAEKMKFGNLIKKIDEDEFEFLMNQHEEEAMKRSEILSIERKELEEFRKAVLDQPTPAAAPVLALGKSSTPVTPAVRAKDFQKGLLSGIQVKKRKSLQSEEPDGSSATAPKRERLQESPIPPTSATGARPIASPISKPGRAETISSAQPASAGPKPGLSALLGAYGDSDDE